MKALARSARRGWFAALLLLIALPAAASPLTVLVDFDGDPGFPVYGNTVAQGYPPTGPLPAFDLSVYDNSPDVATVENSVLGILAGAYSRWQVNFVTTTPLAGDYTTIGIGGDIATNGSYTLFGIAQDVDVGDVNKNDFARVFGGSFSLFGQWQGGNSTAARIANAIGYTAAHELAHNLGLFHGYAWDTYVAGDPLWNYSGGTGNPREPGDLGATQFNSDPTHNEHIMATGSSGLSLEDRASAARFFGQTETFYLDQVLMRVPEPSMLLLLMIGGLALRRRLAVA